MIEKQSRLKRFKAVPALLLLFVWCFQLAVPAIGLAWSARQCAMPCCLPQIHSEDPCLDETSQPAASCCHVQAALPAGHKQPAAHDGQACSAKLCAQGHIFIAAAETTAFAQAESGIKYILQKEEQVSVKYSAELFRPPRAL